jgi:hypothetical protein
MAPSNSFRFICVLISYKVSLDAGPSGVRLTNTCLVDPDRDSPARGRPVKDF